MDHCNIKLFWPHPLKFHYLYPRSKAFRSIPLPSLKTFKCYTNPCPITYLSYFPTLFIPHYFNFAKDDWAAYKSVINNNINLSRLEIWSLAEIDDNINSLTNIIFSAANQTILKHSFSPDIHPLLQDLKLFIIQKNFRRRHCQVTRNPLLKP